MGSAVSTCQVNEGIQLPTSGSMGMVEWFSDRASTALSSVLSPIWLTVRQYGTVSHILMNSQTQRETNPTGSG